MEAIIIDGTNINDNAYKNKTNEKLCWDIKEIPSEIYNLHKLKYSDLNGTKIYKQK